MGQSLGWVAVRGSEPDNVRAALGLRDTGARTEVDDPPLIGAILREDWYVVIVNRGEHLLEEPLMRRLSTGCEAVACFLEEHVMYSAAVGWSNGRRVWSATHDSDKGLGHLVVQGELPSAAAGIRARLEAKQHAAGGKDAGVDHIFDIPIEIAKEVTGFRHDADANADTSAFFEVLAVTGANSIGERSKPWWKRLLGG